MQAERNAESGSDPDDAGGRVEAERAGAADFAKLRRGSYSSTDCRRAAQAVSESEFAKDRGRHGDFFGATARAAGRGFLKLVSFVVGVESSWHLPPIRQ